MYKFLPYQSVHKPVAQSYYFDDCFTKEEIKEIIKLGENTDAEQAGIDEWSNRKKTKRF